MNKIIAAFALFFALSACGPVIETHYDYIPPANSAGMKCVASCQEQQTFCQADNRRFQEKCRRDAERNVEREYERKREKYIADLKLHAREPGKYKEPKEPYRASPSYWQCDNQGSDCQGGYNMCYRSCGGQIGERQVCVQNCEQK